MPVPLVPEDLLAVVLERSAGQDADPASVNTLAKSKQGGTVQSRHGNGKDLWTASSEKNTQGPTWRGL